MSGSKSTASITGVAGSCRTLLCVNVLADFRGSALILPFDVFGAKGDVPQSLNQVHEWPKDSSSF